MPQARGFEGQLDSRRLAIIGWNGLLPREVFGSHGPKAEEHVLGERSAHHCGLWPSYRDHSRLSGVLRN